MLPTKISSTSPPRSSAERRAWARRSLTCSCVMGYFCMDQSSVLHATGDDFARGRSGPAVVRRRRAQLPLEAVGAFPGTRARLLAGLDALPDDVREQQLRETEAEGA